MLNDFIIYAIFVRTTFKIINHHRRVTILLHLTNSNSIQIILVQCTLFTDLYTIMVHDFGQINQTSV
jgi:hypothetical protein